MRSFRLLVLAASLAASVMAMPAYASGGNAGGGGGGNVAVPAAPATPVRPVPAAPAAPAAPVRVPVVPVPAFRMVGGLFDDVTHQFEGYEVYTRDPLGRARLSVVYFNTAHLPATTVLNVFANGVKVGTMTAIATTQAESLTTTIGLPPLALGSRISLTTTAGKPVASGIFTLRIL